jgi:hypothetical protein
MSGIRQEYNRLGQERGVGLLYCSDPSADPGMNAAFFVATQGAMLVGAILWGTMATFYGPNRTLDCGSYSIVPQRDGR